MHARFFVVSLALALAAPVFAQQTQQPPAQQPAQPQPFRAGTPVAPSRSKSSSW